MFSREKVQDVRLQVQSWRRGASRPDWRQEKLSVLQPQSRGADTSGFGKEWSASCTCQGSYQCFLRRNRHARVTPKSS